MKNPYLIVIATIIIFIFSIFILSYLLNNNLNDKEYYNIRNQGSGYMVNNSYVPTTDSVIERFDNQKKEINNLIVNGSFQNGLESPTHVNDSGYNKIIMMKNPGSSNYVLQQKATSNDTETYYQFSIPNRINTKFVLTFYLCIGDHDIKDVLFDKLIYVKMQNEDFSIYIPRMNYYVIQKTVMSDENTWYEMKYVFTSGSNTIKNMQLYFNYSKELQFNEYYFADIKLSNVLVDVENFVYTNSLISYVDGYYYEAGTWHDLGGLGNDMYWSQNPVVDFTRGFVNSRKLKLTGFQANQLSQNGFTILMLLSKNNTTDDVIDKQINTEEENQINETENYLISIPGNDRYSFEIKIENDTIILMIDNKSYKSKQPFILYNKCLLVFIYDGKKLNIYYDGVLMLSEPIRKIYLNQSPILINKNRNLDYNFYSILFYNRLLETNELDELRTYFIENKNRKMDTMDVNDYLLSNSIDKIPNNNITIIKPYNKKDAKYETIDDTKIKFNDFKENFNPIEEVVQDILEKNIDDRLVCPKVYKKDGNYMVYIPDNSYYSSMLNYSGERSYGSDIEKARYTYYRNFPKCPIPDELMHYSNTDSMKTCPYIINEGNPCFMSQCSGVNWNVDHYKKLNLNKSCKKHVSNYCHINSHIDERCICWKPEHKNDPKCIEFKKYIEDPNDYCSVSQFNIEEHPDFNKYIRKDNIPCWGCNLTM